MADEDDLCRVLDALAVVGGAAQLLPHVPGLTREVAIEAADDLEFRRLITVDSQRGANGKLISIINPRLTQAGRVALEECRRRGPFSTQSGVALDQSVEAKDRRRGLFIQRLYDEVGGDETQSVTDSEIGSSLGWPSDETERVVRYLGSQGLLNVISFGGHTMITHKGILEVEQSRRAPEQDTEHLPAYNTIIVEGSISNSQLAVSSPGATQSQTTITTTDSAALRELIQAYRNALDEEPFSNPADVLVATTTLDAIEAQLDHPTPNRRFIEVGLRTLGEFTTGVAASAAWSGVLAILPHIHL